jgi:hypothetical protein
MTCGRSVTRVVTARAPCLAMLGLYSYLFEMILILVRSGHNWQKTAQAADSAYRSQCLVT